LCSVQIWWTTEVNIAFGRLEEGYDNALKEYNKKQVTNSAVVVLLMSCLRTKRAFQI